MHRVSHDHLISVSTQDRFESLFSLLDEHHGRDARRTSLVLITLRLWQQTTSDGDLPAAISDFLPCAFPDDALQAYRVDQKDV